MTLLWHSLCASIYKENDTCKSSEFVQLSLSEDLKEYCPFWWRYHSHRLCYLMVMINHSPLSLSLTFSLSLSLSYTHTTWKVPRGEQRNLFLSYTPTLTFPISPHQYSSHRYCLFSTPVLFPHFGSLFPRQIFKWVIEARCEYHSLVCVKRCRLIES